MQLKFYKYQGTGNDFILFDNRDNRIDKNASAWVAKICDRRFGVGADGVILLEKKPGYDFKMVYFNSDGRESSMCGNGGRCIVNFAHQLGIEKEYYKFLAVDGEHEAYVNKNTVFLKMHNVDVAKNGADYWELNTGSPHYVKFVSDLKSIDVKLEGSRIRNSDDYSSEGINVNFLQEKEGTLLIRTYERGVEDETFSCGTGVTAAAISYTLENNLEAGTHLISLETLGGTLQVRLVKHAEGTFTDIWLIGPGTFVYEGMIEYP